MIPNWVDGLLFALAVAGACYVALELCWKAEGDERWDDEERA